MISPYQQNIDILKGFFRRPIVIALSVGTFVSVFVGIVLSFFNIFGNLGKQAIEYLLSRLHEETQITDRLISTSGSSGGSLDIMAILFAVVFLLFFILSRRQENKLGAPSVMFKVISIITVVGAGILLVFMLLALLLIFASASALDSFMPEMSSLLIPLYIFLSIFFTVTLLSAISQLIFSLSIRKSLTSIYLKRTGAVFFGVMSFVSASFGIAMLIFLIIFLSNIPFITMNDTQITVMCITSAISVCNSVLAGILALQYSNYIKNISQKFKIEFDPQAVPSNEAPVPPVQQYPTDFPAQQAPVPPAPTIENFSEQNIPAQEINPFEQIPTQPQPAPMQSEQVPAEPPQAPYEAQPYVQPAPIQPPVQEQPVTQAPQQAPQQPNFPDLQTPRFCTQCGKPVGADDYFCNHCGTKIIRN